MRRMALLTLYAAATACSGPLRVDQQFRVDVTTPENTCGDDWSAPYGAKDVLDVFQRSDEALDLGYRSTWVPGSGKLEKVSIDEDGNVSYLHVETTSSGAESWRLSAQGNVTMAKADLTVAWQGTRAKDDGSSLACKLKVSLKGAPRPLGDPKDRDGSYRLRFTSYGRWCPGDPARAPKAAWTMYMDVDPYAPDTTGYFLDDQLYFDAPEDGSGVVAVAGKLYLRSQGDGFWFPLIGTVVGSVRPDAVSLSMLYSALVDPPGCTYLQEVTSGAKRIPDPKSVDGEYRATYRWTDDCNDPASGVFDGKVDVILQDDGTYMLKEKELGWNVLLTAGGGGLSYVYDTPTDTLTYEGHADPPRLTYRIVRKVLPYGSTKWCTSTYDVEAHARYSF